MKTITTVLALFLVVPATLWGAEAAPKAAEQQVLEIQVKGMTCPFCAYGIEKNLSKLPGVKQAQVSLEAKKARVAMQPGQAPDEAAVRKVIVDSGFTPGEATVHAQNDSP
ncbi:MAG: heavy-metal-associated domain-containing protein [Sulfuricaulis sp.]